MHICKGNFGIHTNLNFNYFLSILAMLLIKFQHCYTSALQFQIHYTYLNALKCVNDEGTAYLLSWNFPFFALIRTRNHKLATDRKMRFLLLHSNGDIAEIAFDLSLRTIFL